MVFVGFSAFVLISWFFFLFPVTPGALGSKGSVSRSLAVSVLGVQDVGEGGGDNDIEGFLWREYDELETELFFVLFLQKVFDFFNVHFIEKKTCF